MAVEISVCGEIKVIPGDGRQMEGILKIEDGWGQPAFQISSDTEGAIEFRASFMQGGSPFNDGVINPLNQLSRYAEEEGVSLDGEVEVTSEWRDYDNITVLIQGSSYRIMNTEVLNADTEYLVAELERRGYCVKIRKSLRHLVQELKAGTWKGCTIGESFSVDIPGFGSLEARAAALGADRIAGTDRKAAVTMVMNLKTWHPMDRPHGAGGWEHSEMRRWLDREVLPQFPDWLREAIVPVEKTSWTRMQNGCVQDMVTSDRLWIPSMREVFGDTGSSEKDGPVYGGLFKDQGSRVMCDKLGKPICWWLRSAYHNCNPYLNDVTMFCDGKPYSIKNPRFNLISANGSLFDYYASKDGGVAVGFCLDP